MGTLLDLQIPSPLYIFPVFTTSVTERTSPVLQISGGLSAACWLCCPAFRTRARHLRFKLQARCIRDRGGQLCEVTCRVEACANSCAPDSLRAQSSSLPVLPGVPHLPAALEIQVRRVPEPVRRPYEISLCAEMCMLVIVSATPQPSDAS